jgi:hypothetical protein
MYSFPELSLNLRPKCWFGNTVPEHEAVCMTRQTNDKKKSSPATRHGGTWGERRYSSYSFLTSALDGGEWSVSHPGRALPLSVPIE